MNFGCYLCANVNNSAYLEKKNYSINVFNFYCFTHVSNLSLWINYWFDGIKSKVEDLGVNLRSSIPDSRIKAQGNQKALRQGSLKIIPWFVHTGKYRYKNVQLYEYKLRG